MVFVTGTLVSVFASSFFTNMIGVHAILGAFLFGLVVPHEGGLAIAMTEKLEDVVGSLFLPLYFTLSGFSTNLGLLNDRHDSHILVELIVLNVSLSAGILTQHIFLMFVLEALLLMFMTTPLVMSLYPLDKRVRVSESGGHNEDGAKGIPGFGKHPDANGFIEDGREHARGGGTGDSTEAGIPGHEKRRNLVVILDRVEHIPGLMTLIQLLKDSLVPVPHLTRSMLHGQHGVDNTLVSISRTESSSSTYKDNTAAASPWVPVISFSSPSMISVLCLIELTDHTSAVMKSIPSQTFSTEMDPLLMIYQTFAGLNCIGVRGKVT
ncbi:hypothetical protein D9758_010399 [Tetrapyrgos nigripes]|uniref:Cation/H+ exchanger transmembrane domain-containing protein n=1 Tax=Tetrapyrgos nigripes TaxID=182062 RepID=A0A8H5D0H5_9AGAR|nr:hypothetical protein D9758_010399 [Tetrapyrgos nigripes]